MRISDWSSDVCSSDLSGMGGRFSPISADMPDEAVASLTLSEDGDVWMGTVNRGLMRFSASRGLEHLDTDMGLPNNRVPSLRSEEHTSELQSLMRNSYAVVCLKKKIRINKVEHN